MIFEERPKNLTAQLAIRIAIFLLFFLRLFFSIHIAPYLLILLIIANLVFIIINKTKGIGTNIMLFSLTMLLFIFLIEYIASIIGASISFWHAFKFTLRYIRGETPEKKKELEKKKEVGKKK